MAPLTYRRPGLRLQRSGLADPLVRALQQDLRSLGYLRAGIDGRFGDGTERAVRALRHDLLNGGRQGRDGDAPLALSAFNRGRVAGVTGVLDERLAACIEDILADSRVPTLPRSEDPRRVNAEMWAQVRRLVGLPIPRPFLLAILLQESAGQHFHTPTDSDSDDFIVVGLDRNDPAHPDRITSRGYGIGQYTLFHHPPRTDEVETIMLDPVRNVQRAVRELSDKFHSFVNGATSATRADDRVAEFGRGPLRPCRYGADDPRHMVDCSRCAGEHLMDITAATPLHGGTTDTLHPTQYHSQSAYERVPDRSKLGCDWPYATRRYNGSGVNSYHYQYQVLQRLTRPPVSD